MGFSEEVSTPRIIYRSPSVTITLPRPLRFRARRMDERKTNRATSGRSVTLFINEIWRMSITWDNLPLAKMAELELFWLATQAGEAFTFQRHWQIATAYPNNTTPIHPNIWTAKRAEGSNEFPVDLADNVKDVYDLTLEMEGAA